MPSPRPESEPSRRAPPDEEALAEQRLEKGWRARDLVGWDTFPSAFSSHGMAPVLSATPTVQPVRGSDPMDQDTGMVRLADRWPQWASLLPPGAELPAALITHEAARHDAMRGRLEAQTAWMRALEQGETIRPLVLQWMAVVQGLDAIEQMQDQQLARVGRSQAGLLDRIRQAADRTANAEELAARQQTTVKQLERLAALSAHIPAWADDAEGALAPTPWLAVVSQVSELRQLVDDLQRAERTPTQARAMELAQIALRQTEKWQDAVTEAISQPELGAAWVAARQKRQLVAARTAPGPRR